MNIIIGISWCKRKNMPRSRSCLWTGARRAGSPALLRHALIALCLYCATGDAPSPEVLTRLLESNRKFIQIPLAQGTGDSLHAAFKIAQQLAPQGHPVRLNILLLRKAFLTLDGITRQLDPDFNAWRETLAYACGVFASEAVVRTWSIQFPWFRPARFLSFRAAHANAGGTFRGHDPKKVCAYANNLLARFGNPCDVSF
jgi:hypothetical protein